MKKYTLALALVALMPFVSASAYEYAQSEGAYYATGPIIKTSSYKKASTGRKKTGYTNVITNNFYYNTQPKQRRSSYSEETKRYGKSTKSQERKYFLAHPFFQPLQGKFGSVTDVSYTLNNFDFNMLNGTVYNIDPNSSTYTDRVYGPLDPVLSGKAKTSQFAVKEDLSYGLTDSLALVLMTQYDSTKTEFTDWSDGTNSDNRSDSGLNLFGIGLQNRFVDTNEWIVMGEAFYQHQKDTANTIMGELKAGYKVSRTTVYGLGRLSYSSLIKGDTYGVYVGDAEGDYLMLSYNTNVKNIFQMEGGMGVFSVLSKDFTFNAEMAYGKYDWHNQMNVKGVVGWQPGDSFALNLYASTCLYDSAKGKTRQYMNYDNDPTAYPVDATTTPPTTLFGDSEILYTVGDYKIDSYNEWKIGIQGILYF